MALGEGLTLAVQCQRYRQVPIRIFNTGPEIWYERAIVGLANNAVGNGSVYMAEAEELLGGSF